MYTGTQQRIRKDADYKTFKQLGVEHISGNPEVSHEKWTSSNLSLYREKVESFGLILDMIELPLSSLVIDERAKKGEFFNILTGKSPERDKEIHRICEIIRAVSEAGIPAVKYNLNIIGIPRTTSEYGRGGAKLSTFRWENAIKDSKRPKITMAGKVNQTEFWERIDYFLEKIVPVAEEFKIRLACHPHDPYTPPGFMGVERVLGTVEGLKRFVSTHENDFHGLNFCQGTVCEMLENPSEEIFDIIRYFGLKNKIFNVHFRNIKGGRLNFTEVFPDEGSVNMLKALRTYKEVKYKYMIMPDHVPQISGNDPEMTAFAYTYGYINALIQAIH